MPRFPTPTYPADMKARVLDRIADGLTSDMLKAEHGWPSRATLFRWGCEDPAYGQLLARARVVGRGERQRPRLAAGLYDEAGAQAFLLRVRRGETVLSMVGRPGQRGRELLNAWKRQRPDFAAAILEAAAFARSLRRPGPCYDEAVADQVILRLHRGDTMRQVWRDPALPGERAMQRWRRWRPEFDGAVRMAQRSGQRRRMKARPRCTPELTDQIAHHILAGGSLRTVAQRPGMPCAHTLYAWMKTQAEFGRKIRLAQTMRDELLMDQALEVAEALTADNLEAGRRTLAGIHRRLGQLSRGRQGMD